VNRILNRAALVITNAVGTMWCAIIFTLITLVSLPGILATGSVVQIVGWVAQTFLQLVLLSVIMVGQNISAAATESMIRETHDAVLVELTDIKNIANAVHANVTQ
jgi:hypothetical protein